MGCLAELAYLLGIYEGLIAKLMETYELQQ